MDTQDAAKETPIFIYISGFSEMIMTEDGQKEVIDTLSNAIFDCTDEESEYVQIKHTSLQDGFVQIFVVNDETIEWIKKIFATLET